MMQVLFDQVVDTDYGQFTLVWSPDGWDGDALRFFAGQLNGWVGAAVPGSVHLVLGRKFGGSSIRIELLDSRPIIDPEAEDVVEVSFSIPPEATVRWESWAAEESGIVAIPPGGFRLRVSARGRDRGREAQSADVYYDEVVDWYVLQAWPDKPAPDAVVRTTSSDARYWNEAWGSRRNS